MRTRDLLSFLATIALTLIAACGGGFASDVTPAGTVDRPDGVGTRATPGDVGMAEQSAFEPNLRALALEPGQIIPIDANGIISTPLCGKEGAIGDVYTENGQMITITTVTASYPEIKFDSSSEVLRVMDSAFNARVVELKQMQMFQQVQSISYTVQNATQHYITYDQFLAGTSANRSSTCKDAIARAATAKSTVRAVSLTVTGDITYEITFIANTSASDQANVLLLLADSLGASVSDMQNRLIKGTGIVWGVLTFDPT